MNRIQKIGNKIRNEDILHTRIYFVNDEIYCKKHREEIMYSYTDNGSEKYFCLSCDEEHKFKMAVSEKLQPRVHQVSETMRWGCNLPSGEPRKKIIKIL